MKTVDINNIAMALCDSCHQPIKPAENVRWGYVSPESDNSRVSIVEGMPGTEALETVVCLGCYNEAFKRVYPDAPLPKNIGGEVYIQSIPPLSQPASNEEVIGV